MGTLYDKTIDTLACENAYENSERTIDVYPQGTYRINVSTQITGAETVWHEAHAVLRVR